MVLFQHFIFQVINLVVTDIPRAYIHSHIED